MPRPRIGTSKTVRLHMHISADELTAIEDWRFANRVATRADAVRRLCALALAMGLAAEDIHTIEAMAPLGGGGTGPY